MHHIAPHPRRPHFNFSLYSLYTHTHKDRNLQKFSVLYLLQSLNIALNRILYKKREDENFGFCASFSSILTYMRAIKRCRNRILYANQANIYIGVRQNGTVPFFFLNLRSLHQTFFSSPCCTFTFHLSLCVYMAVVCVLLLSLSLFALVSHIYVHAEERDEAP